MKTKIKSIFFKSGKSLKKNLALGLFSALLLSGIYSTQALAKTPDDVVVNVNGMVCSFCTSNIEKRFKKDEAVKEVVVNLDEKKVYLSFKDKASLTDEQITSHIKKAGYNVVSIDRK